jgi:hypothetical protein
MRKTNFCEFIAWLAIVLVIGTGLYFSYQVKKISDRVEILEGLKK